MYIYLLTICELFGEGKEAGVCEATLSVLGQGGNAS